MENILKVIEEIKEDTSDIEGKLTWVESNTSNLESKLDIIIELLEKIVDTDQ